METRRNRRGILEHYVRGRHLNLDKLKKAARGSDVADYLFKENIPKYPHPEFHVRGLKHETDQDGLEGIRWSEGFTSLDDRGILWWSLDVSPGEMVSAERRLLENIYPNPNRTREQEQMPSRFLRKFASSPAFLRGSRLGSYRFTFPLKDVLGAYQDQFCGGAEPVMRVMETVLYKQEVMYVVLVHSPDNQRLFKRYPLLRDNPDAVCCYRDDYFLWRPEAMCKTHWNELVCRDDLQQVDARPVTQMPEWYVWDHVAIALHVGNQLLHFDVDQLRKNLKYCKKIRPPVCRDICFDYYTVAEGIVGKLWPHHPSTLRRPD
ncbi:uncharacterized protein LOC121519032 [Cheilinus undulatus]|uniref:uncharacterized protein LOC121519032 n=1 Tax=Cheilinus undulatus TaxID=241271 RepID=UPI001BD44182|nr:uncharacterized protein LOC121519032 [Cheilinus undulatus]